MKKIFIKVIDCVEIVFGCLMGIPSLITGLSVQLDSASSIRGDGWGLMFLLTSIPFLGLSLIGLLDLINRPISLKIDIAIVAFFIAISLLIVPKTSAFFWIILIVLGLHIFLKTSLKKSNPQL